MLNQRNTSGLLVDGQLRVNGTVVTDLSVVDELSGYVQQDDIFIETLTVAEHLWFQAKLRVDHGLTDTDRQKIVDDIIYEV